MLRSLVLPKNSRKTERGATEFPTRLAVRAASVALLRNSRKTEHGAKHFLAYPVVRAAPFALLRNSRKTEHGAKQFLAGMAAGATPVALMLFLCGSLFAQMPKGFYAWWSRPEIRQDLKLTNQQQRQIRATVAQFRPRLIDLRAEVNKAEIDLAAQFDHDPVDPAKASQAIERLIAARSDLTRNLSQLSLKLRTVLTEQQWQELQRRRPPGQNPGPSEEPPQK